MKLYKLTDSNGCTRNNTQWGPGITHRGTGKGDLCGPGWIHTYTHPLLAVLLNPIHANFNEPRLWEAEGEIGREDELKIGCVALTTIKEIEIPKVTTEQRIAFGILCVLEVYKGKIPKWERWAEDWLSGRNRSRAVARAAAEAAGLAKKNLNLIALAEKSIGDEQKWISN